MQIGKNKFFQKYGLKLPNGKYQFYKTEKGYNIFTVKDDTDGCVLVGQNKIKGKVINSRDTFNKLINLMYDAYKERKETFEIEIK